ncbi:MAG TPA: ATP-binding protein [Candidatus Sulfomarinibacteraceae bacterium]|nr:ATP-binding protein [Candidatus Sulfomarinibacteraceae bacterium]
MRRSLTVASVLVPLLLLVFFWLRPDYDPVLAIPLSHFYIVTFTSFAAAVVSFLLVIAIGSFAHRRHVLAAVSFAVMSSLFMVHGLTTPGALIPSDHPAVPAVTWSAWLTLFSGGIIFALAGFDGPEGPSRLLLRRIILVVGAGIMIYLSIVITIPQWLGAIEANAAPWHRRLLFFSTLAVWLLAALQMWRVWRATRHRIDGVLTLVAVWMIQGSISLHLFPVWNGSWWLYHFLLLAGFLFTAFVLFTGYEQSRRFSLIRYYVGASLIMTALLALAASYLFTRYAERTLGAAGDLSQMANTILEVRAVGLLIGAGTMGLLFAVLLVVVTRADRILTTRTRELAIAYRDLRRAEEMRDDLTHMIVHDLRTPLTAISASLSLLKRLPEGKRQEMQGRIVARTSRAAERLDSMIDDILMVAKFETGELHPSTERVQLADLLSEQLDPFRAQAVAEDKVLTIDCAPDIPVELDPVLTGRVLDNLVGNAFKYTEPGGHITVSAEAANGNLLLRVRDDGQGIPDDFKEYIFQKFSQVPADADGSRRKGAGLGLTFCRLVAEAHGGRIWVEDAPGGGSEFKLQLPAGLGQQLSSPE